MTRVIGKDMMSREGLTSSRQECRNTLFMYSRNVVFLITAG